MNTLESALLAKADAALEQADLLLKAGHPDGEAREFATVVRAALGRRAGA